MILSNSLMKDNKTQQSKYQKNIKCKKETRLF